MAKVQVKKLTGFKKKILDIIKELEDREIAFYRRKRIPRRSLRLAGKLGAEENIAIGAIRRRVLVSPEYAKSVLRSLCNENFLSRTKLDKYTLSQEAIESIARELQKRGYLRDAVRRLLRRDLAKRGYIKALSEHKAPRKTTIIPPIIGYFK